MKNYSLNFTEQEVNAILFALSQRPYIEVVELIAKIHEQAGKTAEIAGGDGMTDALISAGGVINEHSRNSNPDRRNRGAFRFKTIDIEQQQ